MADPGVTTGGTPELPPVAVAPAQPPVVEPPPKEPPPPIPEDPPPPLSGFPPPPAHFVYPPLQTNVEEYRVTMDPLGFQELLTTRTENIYPAEFTAPDGTKYPVEIRLRGNSSRGWPKKSYRIEFQPGVRFQGRNHVQLISAWREQTLMLEKLGYDMLDALGVPAPRVKYVRVVINGQYQGIYHDIERVDQSFLRNHGFVDTNASIWRCGMKNCEMKVVDDPAYNRPWEKKTNELLPSPELDAFMRLINRTPEPQFVEALSRSFELEHHLRTFVMDALNANATVEDSQSYVIYDAITRRWSYVPWDLNNTDAKYPIGANPEADFQHPLFNHSLFDGYVEKEYEYRSSGEAGRWKPIFSNLNTRLVLRPELRAHVLDLTEQALTELFAPSVIHARIDAIYELLKPHQPGSPYDSAAQFHDGPRYLKEYVANRTQFLRGELARWRSWKPGLSLQTVSPADGWVELKNLGTTPVSTAGLVLTTELRWAKVKTDILGLPLPGQPALLLGAQTLEPGATLRVSLPLADEGEVGLFDGVSVVGVLDALYYGKLPVGRHYARSLENPLEWEVR